MSTVNRSETGCTNRPETTAVELGLRRRENESLLMRESQCLDTDLNRMRDLMGRRIRISVNRSELAATLSAADDDDEYFAMEEVCDTSPVTKNISGLDPNPFPNLKFGQKSQKHLFNLLPKHFPILGQTIFLLMRES